MQSTAPVQRSWMAYISAGLGASALLGVLSFHFPELLTSRDFRAAYTEEFARGLVMPLRGRKTFDDFVGNEPAP